MSDYDISECESETFYNTIARISRKKYIIYILLIISLLIIVFNIFGLIIGKKYEHAECYNNKFIMSLATWIIAINAGSITIALITFMVMGWFIITDNTANYESIVLSKALILWFGFTALGMSIIALIEVFFQFQTCLKEVGMICGVILAMIVTYAIYPFAFMCLFYLVIIHFD